MAVSKEADASAEHGLSADSSSGKDDAMAMVGEQRHAIDPAVAARAVRKIDWFLIPAMIVGCKCHTDRDGTDPVRPKLWIWRGELRGWNRPADQETLTI